MASSNALSFATPLPQSDRSAILEWRFPKPFHGYVLTGKSRAAWHTSFVIPQLNLLLDAGLCVNHLRPKHIFLTHGHSDHAFMTPAFVKRDDPPDIFCPAQMSEGLDALIHAKTLLNLGGLITREQAEACGTGQADDDDGLEDAVSDGPESAQPAPSQASSNGTRTPSERENPVPPVPQRPLAGRGRLATHATRGLRPGDEVPLERIKGAIRVTAEAFECAHTVPCLGYVFYHTTQKLLPEFTGRPGAELAALRRDGATITGPVRVPVFAFLGDGTAETLAASPAWLRDGVAAVITECSFLYEEHRAQAEKTRHTIWADLEPVIRRWPETVFVLMHFSLRYTDEMIGAFFRGLKDPPRNMVLWVDGIDVGEGKS